MKKNFLYKSKVAFMVVATIASTVIPTRVFAEEINEETSFTDEEQFSDEDIMNTEYTDYDDSQDEYFDEAQEEYMDEYFEEDQGGGSDAVSRAESWVGRAEYVWGACSPGEFDDSGFVAYCITGRYARVGTTYTFLTWPQTFNPQPGDICVCSGHCGIYVGNGEMIHAATEGLGVRKDPVHKKMIFVKSIY